MPVRPPSIQPFCFPLPPEIKPPKKIRIKEIVVMTYFTDDSSKDVNRNIVAKRMLLIIIKIKIVNVPYSTALPRFFDSSIMNLSLLYLEKVYLFQINYFSLYKHIHEQINLEANLLYG